MGVSQIRGTFLGGSYHKDILRNAAAYSAICKFIGPRPSIYPLYTLNKDHIPLFKGYKGGGVWERADGVTCLAKANISAICMLCSEIKIFPLVNLFVEVF